MKYQGLIALLGLALMPAFTGLSAPVQYSLVKGYSQTQTGETNFAVQPYPWFLESRVVFSDDTTGFVSIRSPLKHALLAPSPVTVPQEKINFADAEIQSDLEASFPDGSYSYSITSELGLTNLNVAFVSSDLPPVPRVANFSDLQSVFTTNPITILWDPIIGASEKDLILLEIENSEGICYSSGLVVGATNSLNGTATSLTVPAGTLTEGHIFNAHLCFYKIAEAHPDGLPGFTAMSQRTDFTIGAVGATSPAIVSAFPEPGATNVPCNVPIVFKFDRKMSTNSFSIKINGSFTGSLGSSTGKWLDDQTFMLYNTGQWIGKVELIINRKTLAFHDLNSNPVALDTRVTSFTVGTSKLASSPEAPRIDSIGMSGGSITQIKVTGEAYRCYQLLSSSNLLEWQTVDTAISGTTGILLNDSSSLSPYRYYRVVSIPQ